jgi:hypothetical protein
MPVAGQPLARPLDEEWNSFVRGCYEQFANGYGEVIRASPRSDKQKSVMLLIFNDINQPLYLFNSRDLFPF